jgi:hypothetical protein|tara:strand:+ start:132 stop:356 length:225 start_codon:yes stop_codon:yes gene_type:complete
MSRSNDDYVATKVEQTFDDDGNTKVAEIPSNNKKNLNVIRQIGQKAKDKFSVNKLLDSKQKPAKVIELKPKDKE